MEYGLEAGDRADGIVAADLVGEALFWILGLICWESSGMGEWTVLEGEDLDGGAATFFIGEMGIWVLADIVSLADTFVFCFAIRLRYLGRTLSSQYECHCCAV